MSIAVLSVCAGGAVLWITMAIYHTGRPEGRLACRYVSALGEEIYCGDLPGVSVGRTSAYLRQLEVRTNVFFRRRYGQFYALIADKNDPYSAKFAAHDSTTYLRQYMGAAPWVFVEICLRSKHRFLRMHGLEAVYWWDAVSPPLTDPDYVNGELEPCLNAIRRALPRLDPKERGYAEEVLAKYGGE